MWWSLSGCARRGGQTSADDSSPRGRSGELIDERLRGRHRRRPQRVDSDSAPAWCAEPRETGTCVSSVVMPSATWCERASESVGE